MYRLTFGNGGWGRIDNKALSTYVQWFHLWLADDPSPTYTWSIGFMYSELLMDALNPTWRQPPADPPIDAAIKERWERARNRFAVRSIEQRVRDGLLPPPAPEKTVRIEVGDADVSLLRRLFADKTCDYQIHERAADLYCSAAAQNDETQVGTMGARFIAPTSRALCRECALPDTDFICSHLLHPQIHGVVTTGSHTRMLGSALCDLGRPEIETGAEKCRAGGHGCWERLIDPADRPETLLVVSPLTLPEAFDFLDAAWRLAHGKQHRLLRLPTSRTFAELATPVGDRAAFDAKLSAVADIMKSWSIPNELLPEDRRDVPADQTLVRLEAAVGALVQGDEDRGRLTDAIATLRNVNAIRVATQHGAVAHELPTALARLGIPYPPEWQTAWTAVQARVAGALAEIRALLMPTP